MNLEFKSIPFDLVPDESDTWPGFFEGLAAAFHNIDAVGDIIAPGAFAEDLPAFLSEGFIGGCNHDWDQPIGKPIEASERPDGLYLKGSISDTTHGRDIRTLMRDGVVRRLSIGFRTLGRQRLETSDDVAAWWAKAGYGPSAEDIARSARGVRLLTRVRLVEVSPVALPANPRAIVTAVKRFTTECTEEHRGGSDGAEHLSASRRTFSQHQAILARLRGVRM